MFRTRREAKEACKREAAFAKRYSEAAIKKAENGECTKAWGLADTARMAAKCALQAHEALWSLSKGNLTESEMKAFELAEIAQTDAAKAERAAAESVRKHSAHINKI